MFTEEELQELAAEEVEHEHDFGYVTVSLSETRRGYLLARAHRGSGKDHGPIYYAASRDSEQATGAAVRAAIFDDLMGSIARESAIDAIAYAIELNSYGV